jgi:hypothetical protein
LHKHPTTAMDPATGVQSLGGALDLDGTHAVA